MKISLLFKKMTLMVILAILITIISGGIINAAAAPPRERKLTIIKNVNIIPMTEEKVFRGQNVLLKGTEILAIGPAAELKIPG